MIPSFVLSIPHTPWVPERVESLARLEEGLEITKRVVDDGEREHLVEAAPRPHGVDDVVYCVRRAKNHEWSAELWTDALAQAHVHGSTHVLQLQDDVIPAPRFWPKLAAMVAANPSALIGLENPHPGAMTAAREGKRWYVTPDGLIGVGYVIPTRMLAHFLEWRTRDLKPGTVEAVTEDTLLALYAICHEIPVVCPIPTIIDHDVSLASTYPGNDAHPYRRPAVTWQDGDVLGFTDAQIEDAAWWEPTDENTVQLGAFYTQVHEMAVVHSRTFTVADAKRFETKMTTPAPYGRMFR